MELPYFHHSYLLDENPHKTFEGQLEFARRFNSKYVDLSEMGLVCLDMSLIPDTCEVLCLQGNRLRAFPTQLPPRLKRLFIENNEITSIPEGVLPPTLEYLCAPFNKMAEVPSTWPPALRALYLGYNQLTTLQPFPEWITHINVFDNPLLIQQQEEETSGAPLAAYRAKLQAEQDRIEEEASRRRCAERFHLYVDELLALALHPDRIDRWVHEGAFHNVFPDPQ
jgi:hypothetical protein